MEEIKMSISEIVKGAVENISKDGKSKYFLSPDIPEKRLNNAIKAIAKDADPNHIIGIIDTTLFGSAKEGFVFFGDTVFIRQMFDRNIFVIPYAEIASAIYEIEETVNDKGKKKTKESFEIHLTDGENISFDSAYVSFFNGSALERFFEEIIEINSNEEGKSKYTNENQQKPLELFDNNIKMSYVKLLVNYILSTNEEVTSKQYAEITSFILRTKIDPTDRLRIRSYILSNTEREDTDTLLNILANETTETEFGIIKTSLFKDLLLLYKLDHHINTWHEELELVNFAKKLHLQEEEIETLINIINHDDDIINKRLDDNQIKNSLVDISSKAVAVGVPLAALYFSGTVGVSAVGMTSGLATLGLGGLFGFSSMFTGIGAIALIGIGTYQGMKKITGMKDVENNKQREKILQEIIRNSQMTLNMLIEDMNTVSDMLMEELRKGSQTEMKIEKLTGIIGMLSDGMKNVKDNINFSEVESIITKIPRTLDLARLNELTNQPVLQTSKAFVLSCYTEEDHRLNESISLKEIQDLHEILDSIGYMNLKNASIAMVKSESKKLFEGIRKKSELF